MKRILIRILDFIIPISCSFCGRYDYFSSKISICKNCISKSKKKEEHFTEISICTICKSILILNECTFCNSRNVFFSTLFFIRIKGELEREIMQKVKFGNSPHLSNYFRLGLSKILPNLKKNYTSIVTIPSNKSTIRKRPIPVCKPVIEKIEKFLQIQTISPFQKISKSLQSGKNFRDRFIHAQSAFKICNKYQNSLKGNYLLVDDIFTTGATINELAKMLLINGADTVDVLVLVKGKQ